MPRVRDNIYIAEQDRIFFFPWWKQASIDSSVNKTATLHSWEMAEAWETTNSSKDWDKIMQL